MDKYAITTGDPNGIGTEITIKALRDLALKPEDIILVSNKDVLRFYGGDDIVSKYEILEIPYNFKEIIPGEVTTSGGEFSYQSLKKVCEISPKAIITAPVSKLALHMAGYNYSGQTEILESFLAKNNQKAEMLFVANDFRVLLLTRHCALKDVKITSDSLKIKVKNLVNTFRTQFGIKNPHFAMCALNPHAGENGILGTEEQDVIIPTIKELQNQGINITLPLPADTLFVNAGKKYYSDLSNSKYDGATYDCYIANYHDQGLIPIKTVAGDRTVNVTIGLDIIRTSPGHGTAFDIAGKNIARHQGMIEAIKFALKI